MDANLVKRLVDKKLGCNAKAICNPNCISGPAKAICDHAAGRVVCGTAGCIVMNSRGPSRPCR